MIGARTSGTEAPGGCMDIVRVLGSLVTISGHIQVCIQAARELSQQMLENPVA